MSKTSSWPERQRWRTAPRASLQTRQLQLLNELLSEVVGHNRFYQERFAGVTLPLPSLEAFGQLASLSKDEWVATDAGQACRTYSLDRYVRCHQTSGTRGRPVRVFDTQADWQWWQECWQYVLDAADVSSADRAFMAFSFGPFIGFWSAFDALAARKCLVIPGGGMTTLGRLELLHTVEATLLCCTPSYALHLAEVAQEHQMDTHRWKVRKLIVAGEPGGSVPSVRGQLATFWQADVLDHAGATEVGAWGYSDERREGLYINEAEFFPEFLSLQTGLPARAGELSELVLTPLGRLGMPLVRYRTGDLVRPEWEHGRESGFVYLPGGVIGRADDMLIVRGVNIFPSSIDQIVRSFPEVVEYRVVAYREAAMDQLKLLIEDRLQQPRRVIEELRLRLGVRVDVECVPLGSLPRYEGKGRRFDDRRHKPMDPSDRMPPVPPPPPASPA